jgi:ABC-type antimicrobial peptide transport system permease subunit
MSNAGFPVNDLLRRKLSTGLTILSLTTCVASTLFLLIFSEQVGFGIVISSHNTLSSGISTVFSQFLTFIGALFFVVGAIIISFIVFLIMAQRARDFGLMKAAGCPNGLVFGYFFTELLSITFIGCVLGTALGLVTDYFVVNMLPAYNTPPNLWFVPLVFVAFFVFALVFGAKPILDAARISPVKAISPVQYLGLSKGTSFKPLSKTGLTIRIASRSLFRRKTATVRIVMFLSAVFLLLTVSIAGGIVASDTTRSWVQKTVDENTILVANKDMASEYIQLLLKFVGEGHENPSFNYSDIAFVLPEAVVTQIGQVSGVANVDSRLIWRGIVQEIPGFKVDPEKLSTVNVGGHRQTESVVVGLDPSKVVDELFVEGHFLNSTSILQAVVGDSLAQKIYSPTSFMAPMGQRVDLADPLLESIRIQGVNFKIVGLAVESLNNGNTVYISIDKLMNLTGLSGPNVALITVDSSSEYTEVLKSVQNALQNVREDFVAVGLREISVRNTDLLSSLWGVIMFLPMFALAAAALCLVSYLMLVIDEQRQEFGTLRATGAKPRNITYILGIQSLIVLLSSFGVGTSLGTIICILILTAKPVLSAYTVVAISGWLLAALCGIFIVSLYPALKFARQSILKALS